MHVYPVAEYARDGERPLWSTSRPHAVVCYLVCKYLQSSRAVALRVEYEWRVVHSRKDPDAGSQPQYMCLAHHVITPAHRAMRNGSCNPGVRRQLQHVLHPSPGGRAAVVLARCLHHRHSFSLPGTCCSVPGVCDGVPAVAGGVCVGRHGWVGVHLTSTCCVSGSKCSSLQQPA